MAFGLVENVPHNQVHVQVGGEENDPCVGGWMVDPNCAAEDPIFWLHHSNIDRLWSVWIGLGQGRANPVGDQSWMTTSFPFFDENGNSVQMTAADVLDTVGQLGYDYEPQPTVQPQPVAAAPPEVAMAAGPPSKAVRLAAATESGVTLASQPVAVRIPLTPPARKTLTAAADLNDASVKHVYLNVEGLKADHTPGVSWEVYVELPPDAPAGPGPHRVGVISFFGFRSQLAPDAEDHGLGPMVHTFDITHLAEGIKDQDALEVSLVPVGASVERMTAHPRIGRISISYH
jgi:hypothetical protein